MARRVSKRPEVLVEQVVQTREQLRAHARALLGVTGAEDSPPLRQTLKDHRLSIYTLFALGLLSIVDTFQGYAFEVLAPDISRSLGISKGTIAGLIALKTFAIGLSPLFMAALVQKRARRALMSIITGLAWSLATIFNAFVTKVGGLFAVQFADGLSSGSVSALHVPLLMDSYPPESRVRALSAYQAANSFGNVVSPLLVALLAGALGLTWRGVFAVLGVISVAGVIGATRLRDPGFGKWDTQQVREAVHRRKVEEVDPSLLTEEEVRLGFFEVMRRLFLVPTVRRLLVAEAIFGVLLIPYQTFLFFFLEERWNMGPGSRGLFFAFTAAVSVVALALYGKRGEDLFRKDPSRVVRLGSDYIAIAVALLALGGLIPNFAAMVALFSGSQAFLAILNPAIGISLLSIIPSRMRPHLTALAGIALAAGGLIGAVFLSGIDRRFGIGGSIVSLLIPGVVGAILLRTSAKFVPQDLDRMIDEILEEEEIKRISDAGGHLPMLACKGIDFSYGQLQVLFGVNFTVDDGEMVALLGVNGAGKSTLLRVISGVGLPSAGSVRFRGGDITYLDAERRVRLGITHVPGGRAVFGPMSVVENMRVFGYTLGRDRRAVDDAIERSFEVFPRLAERRNQSASTLSGGEQQMLGLSRSLILRPRLLLIDELSLGLAPVIVAQLLEMVREINQSGTAVVLVEQSVNIALNLVEHAYFMEKGEIRFDGRSRDLLRRDDLLRAVFLEGASKRKR
ncbi:MAG TPA: MFS transporter [Actinomycetota bacterium]|jgi:ABC-type branched-subunit amino acid transport system ATPase component/MFS family permease|nr:MFS transporter [Actinomycetota bacterium]